MTDSCRTSLGRMFLIFCPSHVWEMWKTSSHYNSAGWQMTPVILVTLVVLQGYCAPWSLNAPMIFCSAVVQLAAVISGPTCLEWPRESGCLKKESGSFLILMGREAGCRVALVGFITALKRASSSVCESPRTCTICCPAGGAPRCASMSPKFGVATNLSISSITHTDKRISGRAR